MKIKATVLCENCVYSNIGAIAEHGWSVFVETDQGHYLFDTGQGKGLINNALYFKKDLSQVKGIILSHHHVDHTGGLMEALDQTGPTTIFAHPDLFKESFSLKGGKVRYIGIPFNKLALEAKGARWSFNTDFTEIAPNIFLTGEVPRTNDYEVGDVDQVISLDGQYVKDPLKDDQSLIMKTPQGLFIILGCSHAGLINILNYAVEMTGESRIHTVIGGTHLGPVSEEQREKSFEALRGFDVGRIGVSHCTGLPASTRLAREYGDKYLFCNVGTVVEI